VERGDDDAGEKGSVLYRLFVGDAVLDPDMDVDHLCLTLDMVKVIVLSFSGKGSAEDTEGSFRDVT